MARTTGSRHARGWFMIGPQRGRWWRHLCSQNEVGHNAGRPHRERAMRRLTQRKYSETSSATLCSSSAISDRVWSVIRPTGLDTLRA